jgi:hypothetical protein
MRPAVHGGSVTRRVFLGALGAAGLEACTGSHAPARTIGAVPAAPSTITSTSTTVGPVPPGAAVDILVLRTASSIEHYAAGVYTRLAGSGLVTTPGASDAMRLFADHHTVHGGAFEGATTHAGGTPFTKANPALSATVEARVEALRNQADAVSLLYGVEQLAVATYTSSAPQVSPALAPLLVGVASAEAMHLTVLATYLGGVLAAPGSPSSPFPPDGFFAGTGALAPGVGIT